MKKLLFLLVLVFGIVGIINAQQIEYCAIDFRDYEDVSTTNNIESEPISVTTTTTTTTTTTVTNTNNYNNKTVDSAVKKDLYYARLVLTKNDSILIEVSSEKKMKNGVYLLFGNGFMRQMKRYSDNIFYCVLEDYKDLEVIIVEDKNNIYIDNTFKTKMEKDYKYLKDTVKNKNYRDGRKS